MMDLLAPPRPLPIRSRSVSSGGEDGVRTPMHLLPGVSADLGVACWVKREDLHPLWAGGSKARKLDRILPSLEAQGHDALVTTGSTRSNHARVVALAAAQHGWPCTLVLHGDRASLDTSWNGRLMHRAGARVLVVPPDDVAKGLQRAAEALRLAGRRPVIIPGGGHGLAGGLAFVDVVREIVTQAAACDARPDVLLHASGTGSTQAGLHVGAERWLPHARVVGISVARPSERGRHVVETACAELRAHLGSDSRQRPVDFRDEWIEQGYGPGGARVRDTIDDVMVRDGILLDATYTGKAFLALCDLARRGEIVQGSTVCFVHTAGWPNLATAEPTTWT